MLQQLFFSKIRPRLLLEAIGGAMNTVSFNLYLLHPSPLHRLSYSCLIQLGPFWSPLAECWQCCQWSSHHALRRISCEVPRSKYCGKRRRCPAERGSAVRQEEQVGGGQIGETAEASQSKTLDLGMKAQYLRRERPAPGHLGHQRTE